MITLLLERAEINFFNQFRSDSSLLMGKLFHIAKQLTNYYPVRVDDGEKTVKGVLFNLWLRLSFQYYESFSHHSEHHLVCAF